MKICVYFPSNAHFWNWRQKLHVCGRGEGKEEATGKRKGDIKRHEEETAGERKQ